MPTGSLPNFSREAAKSRRRVDLAEPQRAPRKRFSSSSASSFAISAALREKSQRRTRPSSSFASSRLRVRKDRVETAPPLPLRSLRLCEKNLVGLRLRLASFTSPALAGRHRADSAGLFQGKRPLGQKGPKVGWKSSRATLTRTTA